MQSQIHLEVIYTWPDSFPEPDFKPEGEFTLKVYRAPKLHGPIHGLQRSPSNFVFTIL